MVWFRMNEEVLKYDVVYDTILDNMSKWGAMVSIIFTCFALFFIKHNSDRFYKDNQNWENFDQELVKLKELNEKQNHVITE